MSIAFDLALMLHIAATGPLPAYPALRRAGALPAAAAAAQHEETATMQGWGEKLRRDDWRMVNPCSSGPPY